MNMRNKFKHKNVLIIGLKKSGISCVNLLTKLGAFCYVFDDNKLLLKQIAFESEVNVVSRIDEDIIKIMDYVVISPAVSIFSEYVKLAKLFGVPVVSELELGTYFAKGKLVGITGTNGKTTTSTLVYEILKTAHKPSVLCGNIGEPITENILPFKTTYVVEMSSFQLESANKIKPNIAVITNLTPNHLDRHLNFKNYREAKYNIFKNMSHLSHLILNYDDKNLRELKNRKIRPNIIWVSTSCEVDGYFVKDKVIYKRKGKKTLMLFDLSNIKLLGKHNEQNILFAVAVCDILKIKMELVKQAVDNFEPLCHRLQFVKNVNGVDYVNDSKSTTPASTITAISSLEKKPIILILGGSDKDVSFDKLSKKISKTKNIRLVVVQGETTKKIVKSLKKFGVKNFEICANFYDAIKLATARAVEGDTILLSPACASFDAFSCFEERGEKFIEYVKDLNCEKKEISK